jgi:transposase
MTKGNPGNRFSTEVRARAVRMVLENEADYKSRSQAIASIAEKFGCSRDTLRGWVNKQDIETGNRDGLTQSERDELKALQRENRELKQANEILRKASAFFAAADLDRQRKR